MQPPKSIKLVKNNRADNTTDIPDLPKQQLYEKPILTTEIITQEVIENQPFMPRGIHLEDLDQAFVDWVKDFGFELDGVLVPVNLFTLQRFSEFMQTWDETDSTKHPALPIITITKETPAKQGTMLGGYAPTLPNGETFPLYKIPKVVNGQTIFEYVEVPQPTYIDLQYKINLFVNRQREVNKMNEYILQEFKKPQNSVNVFGHNMELKLDDISENHNRELEQRRYYRQIYVVNLKAFILDEKDFKIKRGVNNISLSTEVRTEKVTYPCEISTIGMDGQCDTCLLFLFNRNSPSTYEYVMPFDFNVIYDNQSLLFTNVRYFVNNIQVSLPFNILKNDTLKIDYISTISKSVQVKICGQKI